MKETVLLINFQDEKQKKQVQLILMAMRIKIRIVEKEEYLHTIGYLVNLKEEEADSYEGDGLEKEMMVFAGLNDNQLNQVLLMMRRGGVRKVDYKAVLTENNREWNVLELYGELAEEHEVMNRHET